MCSTVSLPPVNPWPELCGYHALNPFIEKGYRHFGHDVMEEETPLEAGLSFASDFNKAGGAVLSARKRCSSRKPRA